MLPQKAQRQGRRPKRHPSGRTKRKGNFGLGSASSADACTAGRAWVGDGFSVASDGKTLMSSNRLRQFRPPSHKPNLDGWQANFEERFRPGLWQSNGHLDIWDLP